MVARFIWLGKYAAGTALKNKTEVIKLLQVKELTNETELSDGLSLMQARVFVFKSGNTLSYVPLEPNPLGYKARLVFTDWGTESVEIDNYERLSVALWNYADMLDEPEALFNDAEQLFKAGF